MQATRRGFLARVLALVPLGAASRLGLPPDLPDVRTGGKTSALMLLCEEASRGSREATRKLGAWIDRAYSQR